MKSTGFKRPTYAEALARVRAQKAKRREVLKVAAKKSPLWTSKKADEQFSKFIRERDKLCYFCPNKATQNSHFWGRGNSSTRYDPLNCDGICGGCHMTHEGSKQGLYRDKKIRQLGQAGYDALERKARGTMKRAHAIRECMTYLDSVGWVVK